MSKKEKKKEPPKQAEVVKLTNGMIDGFLTNPSILKLRQLKGLRAALRYEIFKLWEMILTSPEAKALEATKNQMVKEHEERQKTLKEKDRKPLLLESEQVQSLFKIESGLEVKKITISSDQLSGEFTPFDMSAVRWIIDFTE